METKSLQLHFSEPVGNIHINYFLTDFDGVKKASFGHLYLVARVNGLQQIDIAEVVNEERYKQEAWIRQRVEENVRLYFGG